MKAGAASGDQRPEPVDGRRRVRGRHLLVCASTQLFLSEMSGLNVGAVTAHGAEFSGQWKPEFLGGNVYFNSNLSCNIAEFQDSFPGFAIAGKRAPDFPEWLWTGGVTLEPVEGAVINLSARSAPHDPVHDLGGVLADSELIPGRDRPWSGMRFWDARARAARG